MYANPSLGLAPIIGAGISAVSSLFGSIVGSDDNKRKTAIDNRQALALQGDAGSLAVLKCWAGIPAPELNNFPALARDVGVNATGSNCGMATTAAKAYAKSAYDYVMAVRSGAAPSPGYSPAFPPYNPTPGYPSTSIFPGGVSPLLLVGGVAVLFMVMKGRK